MAYIYRSMRKFPIQLRNSIISPTIKDTKGDSNDYKNYRPVSNTPFLGKLLEKIVLQQLQEHLDKYDLQARFQSGYRKFHSCETAMFRILNDIKKGKSRGSSSVLVLLDLSAAFDTIDHAILLKRLNQLYGLSDTSLNWIKTYLTNNDENIQCVVSNEKFERSVDLGSSQLPTISDYADGVDTMAFLTSLN